MLVLTFVGVAGLAAASYGTRFLLYSPTMLLLTPDQIELSGNHIVSREAVMQQFVHDHNRSVLRVALDTRRSQIEQIPWVESASVQRILPNRIRVELTERTPVAFARNGNELALIDAHGVILERPQGEDLRFPIVSGVSEDVPRDQREKRMQVYMEFTKGIDLVRAGSSEGVSELDLSNPKDLRVVMTGLAGPTDSQAVTIHFGAGEFTGKYKMLVDNFSQWQANTGRVQSIDLQYMRQVVVNPDTSAGTAAKKTR
jgi:cell division protein FtsQ